MGMKLGFSSLGCPAYTVDQLIETATKFGYTGISLRTVRGESMLPSLAEFAPENISSTREKFARAGVEVLCVSSGVRFTSADRQERKHQLEIASQYIGIAKGLGSPYVRIFGGPYPGDQPESAVLENIVEGFKSSCEIAASQGVSVMLETHDSFSKGEKAADLVRRVGKSNLFIVWDILHSYRFGESFAETWKHAGPYIKHVHIKDSNSFNEKGFDLAMLGKGKLPVIEAVEILIRHGYKGFFEFEWEKGWHPEIPDAEIAFPHGAGYLECLWQMLTRYEK